MSYCRSGKKTRFKPCRDRWLRGQTVPSPRQNGSEKPPSADQLPVGFGLDYLPTRIPAQSPPHLPENERSPKGHLNKAFLDTLLFLQIISLTLFLRTA